MGIQNPPPIIPKTDTLTRDALELWSFTCFPAHVCECDQLNASSYNVVYVYNVYLFTVFIYKALLGRAASLPVRVCLNENNRVSNDMKHQQCP